MPNSPSPYELNRATYDRIAPQFAQINAAMPPNLAEAAARMLERLSARPGSLLDLGCGAGRDLAYLEALSASGSATRHPVAPAFHGFGADLSAGMLAQARQVTHVPLCQADMRFLPFATSSFQAVWCSAALLHLPFAEAPRALAEIARVLRAGGLLFVSLQKGNGEALETGYNDESAVRLFARYQPESFAALLRQAGFSILDQGERKEKRDWLWFDCALE